MIMTGDMECGKAGYQFWGFVLVLIRAVVLPGDQISFSHKLWEQKILASWFTDTLTTCFYIDFE